MNYLDLAPGIEEYTHSHFLVNLRKTIEKYPGVDFSDCMSRNQIKSKVWLIDELIKTYGNDYENIFVLCGWYGILPAMLMDNVNLKIKKIRSIDIDESCELIADSINYDNYKNKWKFKSFTADVLKLNYKSISLQSKKEGGQLAKITEQPQLIINTSCEHIEDFESWLALLPSGLKVIFQSNNYDMHAQHVNCSNSLEEFIELCNLSNIDYSGSLDLQDYSRYMIMGSV